LHALLKKLPYLLLLCTVLLGGCRKARLFTDDPGVQLDFSQDTILFDTVFTVSPASVMKRFVARNNNDRAVRVNITLEGGTPSPYRINVDGVTGTSFSEVEILGNDSVFVFVEVTLDQNNAMNPLVVEDRILFSTNGGTPQEVRLIAWGQDAYYHYIGPDSIQVAGLPPFNYVAGGFDPGWVQICEDVTWLSDKPHVIFGYAVVDSCSSLTIEAGARIHVHGGGGLWVYRYGRIQAIGTLDQPITFQGDRLEPEYAEIPGQWDRIWVNEGDVADSNEFEHVVIKNALIGLQAESDPFNTSGFPLSANRLILNNVKIRNCSAAGILSRNYRIRSTNLLVGDCGQYGVALTGHGEYVFNHTTIANYWSYAIRQTPAFILTNSFNGETRQITNSQFLNGIIWGSNGNEFQLDISDPGGQDLIFDRYVLRTDQPTDNTQLFPNQGQIYRNNDPRFVDANARNFDIQSNSPAVDQATVVPGDVVSITDIDNSIRCGNGPDLGAYEYCP
jgi:hypothetical protein